MHPIIIFILGIIAGLAIAQLTLAQQTKIGRAIRGRSREKNNNKQKIISFLRERGSVTNDEVEEIAGVSNSTAWNYLEELEQEGAIRQVGKTGRSVKYELKQ